MVDATHTEHNIKGSNGFETKADEKPQEIHPLKADPGETAMYVQKTKANTKNNSKTMTTTKPHLFKVSV